MGKVQRHSVASQRIRAVGGVPDWGFCGWDGYQREDAGPDFALVLSPSFRDFGAHVTRAALDRGFSEFQFQGTFVALPGSRSPNAVMARRGSTSEGDGNLEGVRSRR